MKIGNRLKELVHLRTGIPSKDLACPRAKTSMTPCVAKDGSLAQTIDSEYRTVCAGCGAGVRELLIIEELEAIKQKNMTEFKKPIVTIKDVYSLLKQVNKRISELQKVALSKDTAPINIAREIENLEGYSQDVIRLFRALEKDFPEVLDKEKNLDIDEDQEEYESKHNLK